MRHGGRQHHRRDHDDPEHQVGVEARGGRRTIRAVVVVERVSAPERDDERNREDRRDRECQPFRVVVNHRRVVTRPPGDGGSWGDEKGDGIFFVRTGAGGDERGTEFFRSQDGCVGRKGDGTAFCPNRAGGDERGTVLVSSRLAGGRAVCTPSPLRPGVGGGKWSSTPSPFLSRVVGVGTE